MRAIVTWLVVLGFVTGISMRAGAQAEKATLASAKPETTNAPAVNRSLPAKGGTTAREEPSPLELELQQLRAMLQAQAQELKAQQQKMQTLESELNMVKASPGAPTSGVVGGTVSSVSPTVTSVGVSRQPAAVAGTARGSRAAARPADQERKSDSIELANGKVRIGTLLYADYAYYTKTGFGPQFLTQINQPGPGNNSYNTFEISRAYINLFYSPNDAVTFRLTPNLYRQIVATTAATGTKVGRVSAIGANTDQELALRIKYAYVDFNTLFAGSEAFKKDKLTIGQQQNPFVDWEENLYGYRWTSLVPWNYLSLSSAQTGIKLQGPIEFNGKQYLDYSIGVFTNASFRQLEQSEKKQAMVRLTVYPFGAKSNYDGLGFTGFYDYGYTNVAPDTGINFPLYRVAALAHYTFNKNAYGIAGEFDYGRNTFTAGNFFSGSGPQDEFGVGTTQFAGFDALVKALQNGNGTKQKGYAAFGHAQIPGTPFTLFAMYHYFLPNTQVDKNPLDFHRIVGGISYKVNDRLKFALTSQNLIFKHSQFTFPAPELAKFNPSLAQANPIGIPNAVPNHVQAVFANMELNF